MFVRAVSAGIRGTRPLATRARKPAASAAAAPAAAEGLGAPASAATKGARGIAASLDRDLSAASPALGILSASHVAAPGMEDAEESGGDLGRMPEVYRSLQQAYRDHLILYQHGSFYNLWGADAAAACKLVPLHMPASGKAGFPIASAHYWIPKIVSAGQTVLVASQVSGELPLQAIHPTLKGALSPLERALAAPTSGLRRVKTVPRKITRIITPGTLPSTFRTEDDIVSPVLGIFPATPRPIAQDDPRYVLCAVDTITGEVDVSYSTRSLLRDAVARIEPREIVLPHAAVQDFPARVRLHTDTYTPFRDTDAPLISVEQSSDLLATHSLSSLSDVYVTAIPNSWAQHNTNAVAFVARCFDSAPDAVFDWLGTTKEGRGQAKDAADRIGALCGTLEYLSSTMRADMPHLRWPGKQALLPYMHMDASTRESLDLLHTSRGRGKSSACLFWLLDQTVTKGGRRMLRERIAKPLVDLDEILRRQGVVAALVADNTLRGEIKAALKQAADLQQAMQTLARESSTSGSPERLAQAILAVTSSVEVAVQLSSALSSYCARARPSPDLAELQASAAIFAHPDVLTVQQRCATCLSRDPGRLVPEGVFPDVDRVRAVHREALGTLQATHRSIEQQIRGLRTSTADVRVALVEDPPGVWLIETTRAMKELLDPTIFIPQKGRSAYTPRFTTPEILKVQDSLRTAGDAVITEESRALRQVAQELTSHASLLGKVAEALSGLDVACSLADVALARGYTRPTLTSRPELDVEGGAHAVVAGVQADAAFVRNSCSLSTDRLWIITGPNMGGKSTFLRQHALMVVLAQMGAYVPATRAKIGIVDRIFTRIGASDNLAENQSTFMLEMEETARIARDATARSLVLLDEIGRGTAMADGMAIAAAVCRHLAATIGCRTLFATHFHELSSLATAVPGVSSHHVVVPETGGPLVFSHRIAPGAASVSHGLAVAQLAGLPAPLLVHAGHIRSQIESALQQIQHHIASAVASPPR
eukprot:m.32718 g.32718  ORF g.32718 m.32718 type:complete len:995 (-) comp5030_c0_seq1:267-3251(-)